jgi:uncharacterized protein involved in exopolysaccharide biosynthesis
LLFLWFLFQYPTSIVYNLKGMDQNAYDFINETGSGPDMGKKKRIIIVAIIAGVLLVIGLVVILALNSGKQDTKDILLPVAGTQADISAITTAGLKDLRDSKLLNESSTTKLVISTHSSITGGYLGKDGAKLAKSYQKTDYTKQLEEAASSGTFDQTYNTILSQRLDLYRQQLVTAYSQVQDVNIKKQIAKLNDEANTLAGEPTTPN